MGEPEAIEILKRRGMTQEKAVEFIASVKRGVEAMHKGGRVPWLEISQELGLSQTVFRLVNVTITGKSFVWKDDKGSRPAELIVSDLTCLLEDEYGMKNVKVVVEEVK